MRGLLAGFALFSALLSLGCSPESRTVYLEDRWVVLTLRGLSEEATSVRLAVLTDGQKRPLCVSIPAEGGGCRDGERTEIERELGRQPEDRTAASLPLRFPDGFSAAFSIQAEVLTKAAGILAGGVAEGRLAAGYQAQSLQLDLPLNQVPLVVERREGSDGKVQVEPPGLACLGTGPPRPGFAIECQLHKKGSQVSLQATPSSERVFFGFSSACRGLGPCSLSMDGPQKVVAGFGKPLPLQDILAVAATGPESALGVGDKGLVVSWNGAYWQTLPALTTATLRGVWGSGTSRFEVVGESGTYLVCEGGSCSLRDPLPFVPGPPHLRGIASGPLGSYAVGQKGALLFRPEGQGQAWQRIGGYEMRDFNGVWVTQSRPMPLTPYGYAVGTGGLVVTLAFDMQGGPVTQGREYGRELRAVTGEAGYAFAGGEQILWHSSSGERLISQSLQSIASDGQMRVLAAGSQGVLLQIPVQGGAGIPLCGNVIPNTRLTALAGAKEAGFWIFGTGGLLVHYDGATCVRYAGTL